MNFEYRPIGSVAPSNQPISISSIALNVVTDWMPGTPNSLSTGFADLLDYVLDSTELSSGVESWILKPGIAGRFEKQWKQVTSWLLGIAFCKQIVELEGYQYFAPVSAFTPAVDKISVHSRDWEDFLEVGECIVKRKPLSTSNLLPDYLLGKLSSAHYGIVSFAESKGTDRLLTGVGMPRQSWLNQASSADFFYWSVQVAITQNLLVATRFNPNAQSDEKRRLSVRCWNSKEIVPSVDEDAFRAIVFAHYYGVCLRLGLEHNAALMLRSMTVRLLRNRAESDG